VIAAVGTCAICTDDDKLVTSVDLGGRAGPVKVCSECNRRHPRSGAYAFNGRDDRSRATAPTSRRGGS
jgi:hypothetical protein